MKKLPATRATPVPPLPAVEEITDREPEQKMIHCVICGSDTHAASTDQMCWVCRRLKISAWRDIEQQVPVQE
jgi:hypothetical protein